MQYVLWVFASLVAYAGGLVLLLKVTPRLLPLSFDEGLFMGIAALDILGGLLTFGAAATIFAVFSGALGAKVLDLFLLLGILIVGIRMSLYSIRPRRGAFLISRIATGVYCFLLFLAAIFCIGLLFVPA